MAEAAHPTSTTSASGACPTHPPAREAPSLFQNGELTFQAHHVGWIVASFFAIVATAVSIWLICKHLAWYTNRRQQRQIARLLMMVPIYAIISCLAYFFWNHAIPLSLIRDAYEGIILAAFFYLLLEYLRPTPAEQKEWFRTYVLKQWAWPFGWVKRKPDGLYFLQTMKWAILQYCWVRPLTTLTAIILNWMGIYCEQSWSPRFGSVWILIIVSISVSVAMYCLIQFYIAIADEIKQHRPILQLFSVKAIIFLMFWQSAFLSALHSFNVIKDTKYMSAEDINVGFAALLQTFEMMLFAFLHVRCFSYLPYRKEDRNQQTPKGRAFLNVLDFRDFWRETRDGIVYMWRKARGKEAEFEARRRTHFERAMGKTRHIPDIKKELPPAPHGLDDLDDSEEDMPLAPSKLMAGAKVSPLRTQSPRDEARKSKQKAKDKARLLDLRHDEELAISGHAPRQRSWWDRVYGRVSIDDPDEEHNHARGARGQGKEAISQLPLHSRKSDIRAYAMRPVDLDEPPPPSLFGRRQKSGQGSGDHIPAEKKPFLNWGPTNTQPPRLPDEEDSLNEKAIRKPAYDESSTDPRNHDRDDGLFGRFFSRSRESSTHNDETRAVNLPSLFQRRQDVVGAVKGWVLPLSKQANFVPEPPEKPSAISPDEPKSIPSIPSLSPSPPIVSRVATHDHRNKPGSPPAAPAQPTPVLHQSLSRARRPGILIADAAGVPPPDALMPQSKDRTSKWVEAVATQAGIQSAPGRDRPTLLQDPFVIAPTYGPPHRNAGKPQATRGPRPQKLVMPTPLSPARYPPGAAAPFQPMVSMNKSYLDHSRAKPVELIPALPPGAGYGPPVGVPMPDSFGRRPQPPTTIASRANQSTFNPYENSVPIDPSISIATEHRARQSRQTRKRSQRMDSAPIAGSGGNPRKSRSSSPFGIEAASSDSESLPRHPALRQHTARRRRRSQPLPEVPASERTSDKASPIPLEPTMTIGPEPVQRGFVLSSPSTSAANLPSPSLLSPALTTNGDTRYPQGTSRSNYFDSYDTVGPYLTNIMDDAPSQGLPVDSSTKATSTRRATTRR
ncbi:hypothetical protein FRC18_002913 [Serendipita sp. 400]|nr:hypothetical protein FRC18_002913 [Serendipita sp. 400]